MENEVRLYGMIHLIYSARELVRAGPGSVSPTVLRSPACVLKAGPGGKGHRRPCCVALEPRRWETASQVPLHAGGERVCARRGSASAVGPARASGRQPPCSCPAATHKLLGAARPPAWGPGQGPSQPQPHAGEGATPIIRPSPPECTKYVKLAFICCVEQFKMFYEITFVFSNK